jgi:aryl-alcohol dehydrogenase-like predicted oxidoreductase
LLDTANAYNDGESERIVGRAMKAHPGAFEVATKVGFGRVQGKPEGLARARVLAACDESRERLGVDCIDLYYLHVPDHTTPIEETLAAIWQLLDQKKIRAWGVSNYASWQILEMIQLCDRAERPRPIVAQQLYNVLIRQLDLEYARFAARYGIQTTVYNPLAGGLLSGKHMTESHAPAGSRFFKNALYQGRYWNKAMFDRVVDLDRVAKEASLSLVELSYAWLRTRPLVDRVLVGPGSVAHLDAAHAALALDLPADVANRIDALCIEWQGTETTYAR